MFTEFSIGNRIWLNLKKGYSVDTKEVKEAVRELSRYYDFITVKSHDGGIEKVYKSNRVNYESLMIHHSYGRPSKLSRQVKAQEASLDY